MQDLFVSLLFELLKKHGRKASYLFSFLKIDRSRLKDLIELNKCYSDVFDPTFLNSSLFDTLIDIIQETNNLRNDFSMKMNELENIIEKQKNEKEEILLGKFEYNKWKSLSFKKKNKNINSNW